VKIKSYERPRLGDSPKTIPYKGWKELKEGGGRTEVQKATLLVRDIPLSSERKKLEDQRKAEMSRTVIPLHSMVFMEEQIELTLA